MRYFDAHVHARLADDASVPARLAAELAARGLGLFHCGLDPRSWKDDVARYGGVPSMRVGAGLHPWQVHATRLGPEPCGNAEAELLERLCWETPYIGELGLDFGRKTDEARKELQLAYFERACASASAASRETGVPRVLSLHSVRAAGVALDVLEQTGALESCRCIFHWFSGTTEELWRAIRAGCWFSLNEMGLSTGKGREYVRLVPADRLLIESDLEVCLDAPSDLGRLERALGRALSLVAEARQSDLGAVRELTLANARAIFS